MKQATELQMEALLDRDQISALLTRYLSTVDRGTDLDADWARSIFSNDVRVEHRAFSLEGIDDIAAGNRFVRDGWDRTFHLSANNQIEVEGDSGHLRAQLLAIHVHPGPTPEVPYIIANVIDADVTRTADGWRFRTLSFRPVWSSGQSPFDIEPTAQ